MPEILERLDDFGSFMTTRLPSLKLEEKRLKFEDSKYFEFSTQAGISDATILESIRAYIQSKELCFVSQDEGEYFHITENNQVVGIGTMTNNTIEYILEPTLRVTLNAYQDN